MRVRKLDRAKLDTDKFQTRNMGELLRSLIQEPGLALYIRSWIFTVRDRWGCYAIAPHGLCAEIEKLMPRSPHTAFLKIDNYNYCEMIVPLLITIQLNLRKMNVFILCQPKLLEFVSHIVETSHDPVLGLQEPLPLGMLTDAYVNATAPSDHALDLAVLLSMIPTVRRLRVSRLERLEEYDCSYRYHPSEVTDMVIDGCVHVSFLMELLKRTHDLQVFNFIFRNVCSSEDIFSRLILEGLKQHAAHSLLHLSLRPQNQATCWHDFCTRRRRNYRDLSVGSLRGLKNLISLAACVDMFIRSHDFKSHGIGVGTVQRFVAWLPASLEALVLHKGLAKWEGNVLWKLFRNLRGRKHSRLPHLRLIVFADFSDFEKGMPRGIRAACRKAGIKIGYTLHECENPGCRLAGLQLEKWERLPWVAALGECCRYEGWPVCEWVPT